VKALKYAAVVVMALAIVLLLAGEAWAGF